MRTVIITTLAAMALAAPAVAQDRQLYESGPSGLPPLIAAPVYPVTPPTGWQQPPPPRYEPQPIQSYTPPRPASRMELPGSYNGRGPIGGGGYTVPGSADDD